MGNSTSTSRKSGAVHRHGGPFRKSHQSQSNHHNLEEEFSDLILHEVKRQKQEQSQGGLSQSPEAISQSQTPVPATGRSEKDQFTDDLLEDEFNELSHGVGILENEELSRNILPVTGSDDDTAMEVDDCTAAGSASSTDLEDISKVDFTKISSPAAARQPNGYTGATAVTKGYQGQYKGNGRQNDLVPVKIKWVNQSREAITKVSIIGSFSKWRNVMKLKQSSSNPLEYQTTIKLPLGVHKLLYVVNNEYRVSDWLPTATDQEGIFFNWFEVLDPQHLFTHAANHSKQNSTDDVNIVQTAGEHNANQIQQKSNSFLAKMSKKEKEVSHEHVEYSENQSPQTYSYVSSRNSSLAPSHDPSYVSLVENDQNSKDTVTYSSEIPEMLVDYNFFKNKSPDYELPEPPQLPAHLNNVLLNKMSASHQPPNVPQPQTLSIPPMGAGAGTGTGNGNGSDSSVPKRPTLRRAESSYYASNKEAYHRSIPNHVILNHLMTTSIRNDVLTVACITRYSGKFVTQIMHSPADTGSAG